MDVSREERFVIQNDSFTLHSYSLDKSINISSLPTATDERHVSSCDVISRTFIASEAGE